MEFGQEHSREISLLEWPLAMYIAGPCKGKCIGHLTFPWGLSPKNSNSQHSRKIPGFWAGVAYRLILSTTLANSKDFFFNSKDLKPQLLPCLYCINGFHDYILFGNMDSDLINLPVMTFVSAFSLFLWIYIPCNEKEHIGSKTACFPWSDALHLFSWRCLPSRQSCSIALVGWLWCSPAPVSKVGGLQ